MLLTAYCLLPSDFQGRNSLGEVGILFDGLVEALPGSLSFRRNPSIDFRVCSGMAMGV
jgi:hypothetical protein